jgi:hypothetical protein
VQPKLQQGDSQEGLQAEVEAKDIGNKGQHELGGERERKKEITRAYRESDRAEVGDKIGQSGEEEAEGRVPEGAREHYEVWDQVERAREHDEVWDQVERQRE